VVGSDLLVFVRTAFTPSQKPLHRASLEDVFTTKMDNLTQDIEVEMTFFRMEDGG
jgi:hypothetical protein